MNKMTIVEATITVLKQAENPQTIREMYEAIVDRNLYTFNTSTPEDVLRVQVVRHCENANWKNMAKKRVFRDMGDGHYTLLSNKTEEPATPSLNQLRTTAYVDEIRRLQKLHVKQIKEQILDDITHLSPCDFERLSKRILSSYGIKNLSVTSTSDNGITVAYGKMEVGISFINIAAQCKLCDGKSKITRSEIDQFRGEIQGRYEQGIFLTNGLFTDQAKGVSFQAGAVPIILIDGSHLTQIMIEQQIGIQHQEIPIYSFNIEAAIQNF